MKNLYMLLVACCLTIAAKSQIVINEFQPDIDRVEIKNLGNMTVNVGPYFLCSFPLYTQISSMTIVSGSTMLAPGGILVLTGHAMGDADDELGLYTLAQYTNPAAMIDYVEWGFSGHTRSTVAVSAGIWSTGSFLPAATSGQSWMYDGSGNTPSDWFMGESTFGAENVAACNADAGNFNPIFNPALCGTPANTILPLGVTGQSGSDFTWIITNEAGEFLALFDSENVNFAGLPSGNYPVIFVASEGTVTGLTVGNTTDDLEGCFDVSDGPSISLTSIDAGGLAIVSPSVFCVGDGDADQLFLAVNGQEGTTSVVISNADGTMVYIGADAPADLDTYPAGSYQVQLVVYDQALPGLQEGNALNDLSGCYDLSNFITIELVSGANCSCLAFAGTLDAGPNWVCLNESNPSISCDAIDPSTSNYMWVLTNEEGNIFGITESPTLSVSGIPTGSYTLFGVGYETLDVTLEINDNINDLAGCFDITEPLSITIDEAIGGTLTSGGNNETAVSVSGNVSFDLAGNSNGTVSYLICNENDVIVAISDEPTFVFADAGQFHVYAVTFTGSLDATVGDAVNAVNASGCMELSSMLLVDVILSVSEHNLPFIQCYPNPMNETLFITSNQPLDGTIRLVDLSGRIVFETLFTGSKFELNVAHLAEGVFFLQYDHANGMDVLKLIK